MAGKTEAVPLLHGKRPMSERPSVSKAPATVPFSLFPASAPTAGLYLPIRYSSLYRASASTATTTSLPPQLRELQVPWFDGERSWCQVWCCSRFRTR